MNKNIISAVLVLIFSSCTKAPFSSDMKLGGKIVSTSQLNKGYKVYQAKCLSCHGDKGDGKGITHRALLTKPRNLTQGMYKFGLSLNGGLPTDEDFANILNHGLNGTAMLPWKLTKEETTSVTQYIKTFALNVWDDKSYVKPERAEFTSDPYQETYEMMAIKKGKEVYHKTAQCFVCHKAYLPVEEMRIITGDMTLTAASDVYQLKPQDTSYFLGEDEDKLLTNLPPDFTYHNVRSTKNVEELYKRISVGVNGTTMPAWKDALTDDEIWAVAYYVNSLIKSKNE